MLFLEIKNFFLDLLFPRTCFGCGKKGFYLGPDCLNLLDFARFPERDFEHLESVHFALDSNQPLVKEMLRKFKQAPFSRDLAQPLTFIIIVYFKVKEKQPEFLTGGEEPLLVPVPLFPKRLRWRGFNQAELLASLLSLYYSLPLLENGLRKEEKTRPQSELPLPRRKKNLKGVFSSPRPEKIENKNIVLVDDLIVTGATLKEAAKTLKENGAKKVYAVVVAHG